MAAANKPGALHYAFILSFFIIVALGITNYMWYKEYSDRAASIVELKDTNQKITAANNTNLDRIETLKKMYGSKLADFGDPSQDNPATFTGTINTDIKTYGADLAGPTIQATFQQLRTQLNNVMADRDSKAAKIISLEAEVRSLRGQYQSQVDTFSSDAKTHEQAKLDAISQFNEQINTKSQKIAELSSSLQTARNEHNQEQEARAEEKKRYDSKIVALEQQIDYLRNKIDELEKLSFESADGLITNVEHSNHTVLLNVGEDDFVKPRMTFSVYARDNEGVGRSADDIKGKIEVIQVIGPHMSVAKIMDEDLTRPIVARDLIYTPIWSPGLTESISVIGFIDLDGDGRSDREQFHQMLATAGCKVDNEVDDEGYRHPKGREITVQTRFLVKGVLPDKLEAQTDEERARADRFNDLNTAMRQEARVNGVRIIKLNDFLSYVGFNNKRRIYLPGEHKNFPLKSGSMPAIEAGGSRDRTSNGQVSEIFKPGKKGPQKESSGTTSISPGGSSGQ